MFLGQEDHGIAAGVATAEKQQIYLAPAAGKNQPFRIGCVRRCGFYLFDIALKILLAASVSASFFSRAAFWRGSFLRGDLLLEALDHRWSGVAGRTAEGFVVEDVEFLDRLADIVVRDDLDFRPEDRISVGMIIMPMRVDDGADRPVCQKLYIRHESPRRRRRGAGIDNQNVIGVDDHNKVGAKERIAAEGKFGAVGLGRGVIDAVGNLLESVVLTLNHRIR